MSSCRISCVHITRKFYFWRQLLPGGLPSVGIESMDKDHKKLLNLINNLSACILCTTGEEFERHNLSELIAYTRNHLKAAEDLLQTNGYPDYEGHKAQHDQMISYVESFVRKYDAVGRIDYDRII
ncbi:MAG: hemerythrin domain-containing protein [Sedimenticolaceae bacterium]